ncbi:hypothetical protein COV15_02750 [Candidatus Woesearchaeota archaeon CG10_big_fil_rev_8_21_14_0_10_34_12]|nr:MAG: hypothetical protein COV15_02750 [Candidatus Woesearchaeota archaeon CG10_big_fil_rev_8_21_14_0_10_34_12]
MNSKRGFGLGRNKVVACVFLTILFIIFLNVANPKIMCKCAEGGFDNCRDYYNFFVVKSGCHCSCWDGIDLALHYIRVIAIPLIGIYFIYSLICLIWMRKK